MVSEIGQRIYELRMERSPKVTQEQLAAKAGVSVEVIKKFEQGRKRANFLSRTTPWT
jgi:transcriptional regulator with XRE-family HTH domain